MRVSKTLLAGAAAVAMLANASAASAEMIGDGITMYMQMGGNPGDGATLARQTGAAQAAEAFGVDLKEQFSAWAPETMINQFKKAVAAKPTCIEIMGHPGSAAFEDLGCRARCLLVKAKANLMNGETQDCVENCKSVMFTLENLGGGESSVWTDAALLMSASATPANSRRRQRSGGPFE